MFEILRIEETFHQCSGLRIFIHLQTLHVQRIDNNTENLMHALRESRRRAFRAARNRDDALLVDRSLFSHDDECGWIESAVEDQSFVDCERTRYRDNCEQRSEADQIRSKKRVQRYSRSTNIYGNGLFQFFVSEVLSPEALENDHPAEEHFSLLILHFYLERVDDWHS